MMPAEKSLKSQNQPLIIGAIILHAIIFGGFILDPLDAFDLTREQLIEQIKGLIVPGSLGFISVVIAALVLRGLLPSQWRDRLVHWHFRNPLPGSRAFTVIGPGDQRVDMQSLENRYGPLPNAPMEQDKKFYAIYKDHQDAVGVRDAHKSYLALRDISVITFLCSPALPLMTYFLTDDGILGIEYFGGLFGAFVIISWAAKTYASRFVENTLAAAS